MNKCMYKKPEATNIRGICILCNKRKQKKRPKGKFRSICSYCDNKRYWKNYLEKVREYSAKFKQSYSRHRKNICEECGFVAKHRCQMDVHHIDENHHNNDPNNLMTLCANCHRLKHKGPRKGAFFCVLMMS